MVVHADHALVADEAVVRVPPLLHSALQTELPDSLLRSLGPSRPQLLVCRQLLGNWQLGKLFERGFLGLEDVAVFDFEAFVSEGLQVVSGEAWSCEHAELVGCDDGRVHGQEDEQLQLAEEGVRSREDCLRRSLGTPSGSAQTGT